MIQNETMAGIERELERLQRESWMSVIRILDDNFHGYPFEDECQIPSEAIYPILQSLDIDDSPEDRFVYRLCELDCFSYRCFYRDENNEAVYWNPLEESHQNFEEHASSKTIHYQIDVEHPAKDIIRMWLVERIKQQDT